MTFNEGMQIDTSTTSSSGGGGRGMAIGGGVGGLVIVVVALLLGVDPGTVSPAPQPGQAQQGSGLRRQPVQDRRGREQDLGCRIIATGNSVDAVWSQLLRRSVHAAEDAIFSRARFKPHAAGRPARSGPFYCPADKTAYFDTDFFQVLVEQFGSSGGPFAQEYVVAHEFGHHVQDLLGDIGRAQQGAQGALGNGVRTELQADCYAGVWAHYASTVNQKNGAAVSESVDRQGHSRCAVRGVIRGRRLDPEGVAPGRSTRKRGHTDRRSSGSTGSPSATKPATCKRCDTLRRPRLQQRLTDTQSRDHARGQRVTKTMRDCAIDKWCH